MARHILNQNSEVILQSSVQRVTDMEFRTQEHFKTFDKFGNVIWNKIEDGCTNECNKPNPEYCVDYLTTDLVGYLTMKTLLKPTIVCTWTWVPSLTRFHIVSICLTFMLQWNIENNKSNLSISHIIFQASRFKEENNWGDTDDIVQWNSRGIVSFQESDSIDAMAHIHGLI